VKRAPQQAQTIRVWGTQEHLQYIPWRNRVNPVAILFVPLHATPLCVRLSMGCPPVRARDGANGRW